MSKITKSNSSSATQLGARCQKWAITRSFCPHCKGEKMQRGRTRIICRPIERWRLGQRSPRQRSARFSTIHNIVQSSADSRAACASLGLILTRVALASAFLTLWYKHQPFNARLDDNKKHERAFQLRRAPVLWCAARCKFNFCCGFLLSAALATLFGSDDKAVLILLAE